MKKYIEIRKSYDFSPTGSICLISGSDKIIIRDYSYNKVTLSPDSSIVIKQQWIKSKNYNYNDFNDNTHYVIYPTLGKKFAFFILIIFAISFIVFIFAKIKWAFVPLGIMGLFIFAKLLFFPSSYLKIREVQYP